MTGYELVKCSCVAGVVQARGLIRMSPHLEMTWQLFWTSDSTTSHTSLDFSFMVPQRLADNLGLK